MVSIPTTSGTGSEVTSFAVISDKTKNMKYPLADYELTPDVAIVDPEFVYTVPKASTAFTGLDVLTHAIEAYVSILANDYTDALALHAIKLVFKYLPDSYKTADPTAREKMHNASCIAGMAFTNAFLGVNHSLAHKLGGEFHIPHGLANAYLLPHVIEYNGEPTPTKFAAWPKYDHYIAPERYAEIAKMMGFVPQNATNEEGVKALADAVRKLMTEVNIPLSIKEAGEKDQRSYIDEKVYEAALDSLAYKAFDDQCTTANPRLPRIEELKTQYIDDNYEALLEYLRRNTNSKDDVFLSTTLDLLGKRAKDVVVDISERPIYKDEQPLLEERKFNVRLLATQLLVSPSDENRRTTYVAMLSELKAIAEKFSDGLTGKISECIKYKYIYSIGVSWDEISNFSPELFALKVIQFSKFGELQTEQYEYKGKGTAIIDSNGLAITYETKDLNNMTKSLVGSMETGIGVSLKTRNDKKLKQSNSENIEEMNNFISEFTNRQKTAKALQTKRVKHSYSDGDNAIVVVTRIEGNTVYVKTTDPDYNQVEGFLKYEHESLMYYYTNTLYKEFRTGDSLHATITSVINGHFSIEKQLVEFMVEDCRENNGTTEEVLCKLIDVKNHQCGWITDMGIGIYSPNDGTFESKTDNVFAYLRITRYGTGNKYGKIDAEFLEITDESFVESDIRHDCITAFAEKTKKPDTAAEDEDSRQIDPLLLSILVRTLFATQKTLLRPVEKFRYLCNIRALAVLLDDGLTESYLEFTSSYLRLLVAFVKHGKIDATNIVPDEIYSEEPSVKTRLAVVNLLSEYGNREYSAMLNGYIEEYKETNTTISNLARLIQTSNTLQGTLSEVGLNIIKREIIRTLSLETEDETDLEAENKVFIGVESGTMEFKGSFIYPADNNMQPEPNKQMRNVFKGLCAFLNSSTGGTLYLGVNDNGYVCGLDNDFAYLRIQNIDTYMRHVQDNVKRLLGLDSMAYIRIEPLHDNNVVAIHVEPHPYRVVELEGKSYLRVNAESREMPENMRLELIDRKMLRDKEKAAAISKLQHAVEKRRIAVLHDYSSSNSLSVTNRIVEAYEVLPADGIIFCFDHKDHKCKVFNIGRIGYVEITDKSWAYSSLHEQIKVDAFHMSGRKPIKVSLQLDLMAKNLLLEEYPGTKPFLAHDKHDENIWYLDIDVYSIYGIGRFYSGLANHIKIIDCPELKAYIEEYKKYL